jgi:hypothetical protein
MAKKRKKDLDPNDDIEETDDEEEVDDEELDDESDDDEEESSDDDDSEDAGDDDDEDDETGDETISMDTYKGLQRTLALRDKTIKDEQGKTEALQVKLDETVAGMDSSEIVRSELQKNYRDAVKRIAALESENTDSKKKAMKNSVIAKDYANLAKFVEYIPDADTEEDFAENCKAFKKLLGDKVNQELDAELDGTTTVVDDESEQVSQAAIDKLFDKAMSLAGIDGKEKEYDNAMEKYLEAIESTE